MASERSEAVVPRPYVYPTVNESVAFTCKSDGLPLSSCFWARTVSGERQVVAIQNGVQRDPVDGAHYSSDKLGEGICGVSVSSVQQDHYGLWSCTLIATQGQALTGTVSVKGIYPYKLGILIFSEYSCKPEWL